MRRLLDRVILGTTMSLIAYVVERRLVKKLRQKR
jgi:hypothetical protein